MDAAWWLIIVIVILVLLCMSSAFIEQIGAFFIVRYIDGYRQQIADEVRARAETIGLRNVSTLGGTSILRNLRGRERQHGFHSEAESRFDELEPEPELIIKVFVASYNEEDSIEACLKSIIDNIRNSKYARDAKIVLLDSNSRDRTKERAKKYVDKVIDCPRGKLNARHHGYVQEECDVIVCADGDRTYNKGWLDGLVGPIVRGEAVATAGVNDKHKRIIDEYAKKNGVPFNGGNSAFRRDVYLKSPFNLNVDQFQFIPIWKEEEIRFAEGLKKYGPIKFVPEATFDELRKINDVVYLLRYMGLRIRTF